MEVSDWAVICTTTTTTLGVCSVRERVLIIVTVPLTCILCPSVYKHLTFQFHTKAGIISGVPIRLTRRAGWKSPAPSSLSTKHL